MGDRGYKPQMFKGQGGHKTQIAQEHKTPSRALHLCLHISTKTLNEFAARNKAANTNQGLD